MTFEDAQMRAMTSRLLRDTAFMPCGGLFGQYGRSTNKRAWTPLVSRGWFESTARAVLVVLDS